jgi:hypothetical protein
MIDNEISQTVPVKSSRKTKNPMPIKLDIPQPELMKPKITNFGVGGAGGASSALVSAEARAREAQLPVYDLHFSVHRGMGPEKIGDFFFCAALRGHKRRAPVQV